MLDIECCRIIAMPANVQAGEHGLPVGMDDYVSKPLQDALSQVCVQAQGTAGGSTLGWCAEETDSVKEAIQRLAQELSAETAAEFIENWLKDTPGRLLVLESQAGAGDQAMLRHTTRAMRGCSALIGLATIHALCTELEDSAEKGGRETQSTLVAQLRQACEAATPELHKLLATHK